jgi:hypothetical protein
MNLRSWAEQCHIVPSPLAGEGQGEGYNTHCICFDSQQIQPTVVQSVRGSNFTLGALSPPLSLSLPHKGGGNRVARAFVPHRMCLRAHPQAFARGTL